MTSGMTVKTFVDWDVPSDVTSVIGLETAFEGTTAVSTERLASYLKPASASPNRTPMILVPAAQI
jgi:hypothetical protein